ncbi:MAG: ubiquinone/menaquinone biosynthesis methyltransferase [Fibrobacteraceae bacterium]
MVSPVRKMFDGISRRYDFLNHALSGFRDVAWRRKCCRSLRGLVPRNARVLDSCGGTGDFLITYKKILGAPSTGVIGDFSFGMLSRVRGKTDFPALQMDALNMPFPDANFDVVLNGFGMRNLSDARKGLEETFRVLAPGGYFMTLEFFAPENRFGHFFYYRFAPLFIPAVGALVSGKRDAYEYLVNSVRKFLKVSAYTALARSVGFDVCYVKACDFGIAYRVLLMKPGALRG